MQQTLCQRSLENDFTRFLVNKRHHWTHDQFLDLNLPLHLSVYASNLLTIQIREVIVKVPNCHRYRFNQKCLN